MICLTVLSCGKQTEETNVVTPAKKVVLTKSQEVFVEKGNDFSFTAFNIQGEVDSSFVIATKSVEQVLGMAMNTCETQEVLEAIPNILQYGTTDVRSINEYFKEIIGQLSHLSEEVTFSTANLYYVNESMITPEAKSALEEYYNAYVRYVNYQESMDWVEEWIYANTQGHKADIWKYAPHDRGKLLYNTCYFKGNWSSPFKPGNTKNKEFRKYDGESVNVQMMSRSGDYQYFENDKYSAISLPYGKGEFDMTVILPNENERTSSLNLDSASWKNLRESMIVSEVNVGLPKYSIRTDTNLDNLIPIPEFVTLFSIEISVSEEGTIATSSSHLGELMSSESLKEPKSFIADRPFVFVISERSSGAILFIGQYCG